MKLLKLKSSVLACVLASLLLSACGESSPTVTPTPPATATAVPTTIAPTAIPLPPTASPTPTIEPTLAGPTVPPTFTALAATPQPAPLAISWLNDGVCYEVFVRSFFDSDGDGVGDLRGLIAKLDYLNDGNPTSTKSLGVNCLWLMPINPSPSYHGYDVLDYYKVNPAYGTTDDFKTLVQEARKRGIRILLDFVPNHTSVQHAWFKDAAANPQSPYRDWYIFSDTNPGYSSPWGSAAWHKNPYGAGYYYGVFESGMPDLNYRNPAVTQEFYKISQFWLQEMGIDGFRIDAIKHLIENGMVQQNTRETQAWLRDYRKFYKGIKPDAFTVGEINGPSTELLGYYPDQLDEYFEFSLAQSLVTSAKNGTASFVGNAREAFIKWPNQRYGSFLTNHDQNRVMSVIGNDVQKMKMAAFAYLTLPGLPFLYYGEEIGMTGFKPDPELRTPLQWASDSVTGGFTSGKPWQKVNADTTSVNVQAQEADPNSLLNLYRSLIKTRRANSALAQGDFLRVTASESPVAAYLRQSKDEAVLVVINMGEEAAASVTLSLPESSLPPGQYKTNLLLKVNNTESATAPLMVGTNGAIKDYTPLPNLPGHSAYIIALKK